ncbi:MAG: glycosyltransferase family 39 protein, partial [Elusimicrobia bacterium]|nr:glycosyltransferase family 39 protein [Elusimicrobiota bacterium]
MAAFPERLKPTPAVARRFAEQWNRLYARLRLSHRELLREEPVTYAEGLEEIKPHWDFPPAKLLDSYRALLLQSENPDEKKSFIILSQMRPWKLQFKPLYFQYGGAFIYPLGAFLQALSWARAVVVTHDLGHYLEKPGDMGRLYLAGRLFILLFQLGSLAILFDIGRRLWGWPAGGLAAVFYSLCPLAVVNSHVLKPHPYAVFWSLLALRALVVGQESSDKRPLWICGLAAGMTAGSIFTMLPLLGLPALLWWTRRDRLRFKDALLATGLGVAVFVAANPYFIFVPSASAWERQYATQMHGQPLLAAWSLLVSLAR